MSESTVQRQLRELREDVQSLLTTVDDLWKEANASNDIVSELHNVVGGAEGRLTAILREVQATQAQHTEMLELVLSGLQLVVEGADVAIEVRRLADGELVFASGQTGPLDKSDEPPR